MKNEDIVNVLKQDYQHIVIFYPFEDRILFFKRNLGSSLNNFRGTNLRVLKAKCIINQGNLRYCSWDKNYKDKKNIEKNNYKDEDKDINEDEEAALEGDILIANFMFEIHRIYKKNEKDINSNDILILQAFSLVLESAVAQGITENYYGKKPWLSREIKRNTHYIFIIPTEWEHGIREKTILPIFKQAGLVDEVDHPCKLLFCTELDAILQDIQKYSSRYLYLDEQKLKLESGRQYILWKLDPINGNTLTMTYNCFEASESKANNRRGEELKLYGGNALRDPVSVYSSNKVYSLTYIDTIRQNVWAFLKGKGIIEMLPTAEMNAEKEKKVITVIDILIGAALICYSEKLKKKEDLTKLLKVYPFENLDISNYNSILNSEDLLKSIDMLEIHEIIFRDNEAVIEEVLNDIMTTNDGSRSSIKTRRRIILANNDYRKNVIRAIELPIKLDEIFTSHWTKALGINSRKYALTDEAEIKLSHLYFNWIYCFALKFKNDAKYQTVFDPANLPYCFKYNTSFMISLADLKFKYSAAFLITRLPPLLLSSPRSYKKNGVLQDSQFTKKSNPKYIFKIDVNLFEPSTFSCVQLNFHGKKSYVKAILADKNYPDNNYMGLPALSNYFKPNYIDGFCYPKRIYTTPRLLYIINTHFRYALNYFSKYDRQKSKNERLFTLGDERLDSKGKLTLNEYNDCLLSRSFDNLIPEIKLELEKSDEKDTKLVEIRQQRYIRVFLMIYLSVLKYNISRVLEKKIMKRKHENTIIGYTILVDAFFFHTYLKESHSSLIELAIASGFAKDYEDCKANVRVISDREEQLLPILEQKLGTNLPLKSFYVHGRLYERYFHITLHQVVIEGLLPNQNSKNITIKSKIITMPYFIDIICDNLWDDAAQNYNCIVPDANCKLHNEDNASLQKFSLTELEGFKANFLQCAKKLLFTDSISELVGISIPISDACGCRLYFGSEDILDLGIIPAIKHAVSVFIGAITNEDIFGMYGIEHFFVAFNYFSNAFHRSYQEYFEYNLKKLIDNNLEKKRLKIPYTVFPEPIGGLLQPAINESCILADSFLYGNVLQVFGETYKLDTRKKRLYSKVFVAGDYRMLEEKQTITIAEKREVIPRTRVIKKVLYVRSNFFDDSDGVSPYFLAVTTKKGSNNNSYINNALGQPERLLEEYIVGEHWIPEFDNILSRKTNCFDKHSYFPLYVTVKYLNHSSLVILSTQMGTAFEYDKKSIEEQTYSTLTERLTIINTQVK